MLRAHHKRVLQRQFRPCGIGTLDCAVPRAASRADTCLSHTQRKVLTWNPIDHCDARPARFLDEGRSREVKVCAGVFAAQCRHHIAAARMATPIEGLLRVPEVAPARHTWLVSYVIALPLRNATAAYTYMCRRKEALLQVYIMCTFDTIRFFRIYTCLENSKELSESYL